MCSFFHRLFTTFGKHYFSFPGRLPVPVKIILVVILNILPGIFLLYTEWGGYFTGSYLRLLIYLMVSVVTALLFFKSDNMWQTAQGLLLSLGISAFAYTIIINLAGVSTSPFSLGWSEGNRFYDYSLTFGKNLYNYTGDLRVPYNTPGRYALWGSLFLIPGLPIWVHRLWDALLWGIIPIIAYSADDKEDPTTTAPMGCDTLGRFIYYAGTSLPAFTGAHDIVEYIHLVR